MRIRSIKPEFWVSESIGRLSREARLLFIGLWSFADDSGRGRGAFPAIAGALFPYDPDALKRLPEWFSELEREGMARRYTDKSGNSYYDLPNWLKHQKIEKPSKSKFPAFDECSPNIPRTLPDISALEQGTGNREQGDGTGKRESPAGAHVRELIEFLNREAGREFSPATKAFKGPIESRLKEVNGDVEGIKQMIRRQCALWKGDPQMAEHLNPETLFRPSKFPKYYANRNLPLPPNGSRGNGTSVGDPDLWDRTTGAALAKPDDWSWLDEADAAARPSVESEAPAVG